MESKSILSLINILISLLFIFAFLFIFSIIFKKKNFSFNNKYKIENKNLTENTYEIEENIYFDKYETNVYNEINIKLEENKCCQMLVNQREFLNGVVRKFKPKKILEIGVAKGGSSSIILNAIKDIEGAHLYSIDLSNSTDIGKCVKNFFPQFLDKWTLYLGDVAAKFMEEIGNNIDMVFIDSAHFEPGEILDFLIVLPFLKNGAIVGFHDIANQITFVNKNDMRNSRNEWAPYIIYNLIRGKSYLPSGNTLLLHDIGIKILEKNQNLYIYDYFRALGGQWQYFPKEAHIELITKFFQKYYDKNSLIIFNEAVEFNRKFVKNNPKNIIYRYNSD